MSNPAERGATVATWARKVAPRRVAGVVTAVLVAIGLTGCAVPRWQSELASVDGAGTDSGDSISSLPRLSPGGTKVAFVSRATNLGPTDTNDASDVYLRDLTTGVTSLVSVNAAGTDSGDDRSEFPWFSPDGSKLLFASSATNLASPTTDGRENLYIRDLATGTTTLVSVNAAGTGGGDGTTTFGQASPDGTKVLFGSDAHNLVALDPGSRGLFERDLTTGVTTRLADGEIGSYSPSGDAIAFVGGGDVWLRITSTGATTRLSTGLAGVSGGGAPTFSHDGTKIAFTRQTTPVRTDVYVHDRVAHTTTLVTVAASGSGGSNDTRGHVWGFDPTNANRLLFSSRASNLVTNDTNGLEDLYVRNLSAGVTRLVTVRADGTGAANGSSTQASWLGSGTKIAFVSHATQFGVTDTNTYPDVYVKDETAGTYSLVSANAAGDDSGTGASGRYLFDPLAQIFLYELSVSADGSRLAFGSDANDLGPADGDRPGTDANDHDIYVARFVTPPS
jgi:Tol biopolymer transport system component